MAEEFYVKLNTFREDIYRRLEITDSASKENYKKFTENLENRLKDFEKIIESFIIEMTNLKKANASEKHQLDKITEIVKFNARSDELFFSINAKIMNLTNEFTKSCSKYDQIFLQNFEVPGLLGNSAKCIYRNFREFIEVSQLNLKSYRMQSKNKK